MPPTFFFYFVSVCFKKDLVNHIFLKFPWDGLFNYFSPSFFYYVVETTFVCTHDYFFMFNIPLDPSSCFFSLNCCLILKLPTSVLFICICLSKGKSIHRTERKMTNYMVQVHHLWMKRLRLSEFKQLAPKCVLSWQRVGASNAGLSKVTCSPQLPTG